MTATDPDLGEFEGKKVAKTTISLRGAGDGLSESMQIDPVLLHHGAKPYVIMETRVSSIDFPEIADAPNMLERKAVLRAGTALIVDSDIVAEMVERQKGRIAEKHLADRLAAEDAARAKEGAQQTAVGPEGEVHPEAVLNPDAVEKNGGTLPGGRPAPEWDDDDLNHDPLNPPDLPVSEGGPGGFPLGAIADEQRAAAGVDNVTPIGNGRKPAGTKKAAAKKAPSTRKRAAKKAPVKS